MAGFSASDAALEGFQVIHRRWQLVLGWCLFSVVSFVALLALTVLGAFAVAATTPPQTAQAAAELLGVLIIWVGGGAVQWVIMAALYRMELRPDASPAMFYLRFGRDEARLFGLWLTLVALIVGLLFAASFPIVWVMKKSVGWGVALLLAEAAVGLWLVLRLSLALPANFATGRFGVSDSWRLTRGRFWSLLGVWLLDFFLLLLIIVAVFIVTTVVQAAIGGFHTLAPVSLDDPQALAERPGAYVFAFFVELMILPIYMLIWQAPFLAAYKAITAGEVAA